MALMPVWIDQSANEDLFGILTEAVRISQSLRRQRACWFVRFPFPGYRQVGKEYETCPIVFEPSFMQAEYGRDDSSPPPTPGLNVEFVLTPSVWKRGDDKGANFEKNEMIKMHCAVVLKESPLDYGAQGMYAPGM